jgi:hypothetical protein
MKLKLLSFICTILSLTSAFGQSSGCTDFNACNYDSAAMTEDGSCEYYGWYVPLEAGSNLPIQACSTPEGYILASRECLEILFLQENYPECITSDWSTDCTNAYESCLLGDLYHGCTYEVSPNYDGPNPLIEDVSCIILNYGICPADLNGDQTINTADLTVILGEFGNTCP